jgi:hypothetical protein
VKKIVFKSSEPLLDQIESAVKNFIRAKSVKTAELPMSVSPSISLRNVSREEAFCFFTSVGNYTGQTAASLDEFLQKIKDINVKSLEFHLYREDFEKWIAQTLSDEKLAKEIKSLRTRKVVGNALRDGLYFIVARRLKDLKNVAPG